MTQLETMTEFEKMQLGLDYDQLAPEFNKLRDDAFTLLQSINQNQFIKAKPYFNKLLRSFGENSIICPPFFCEYGKTISVGHDTYINMGATMLDNAAINIGNNVLIGPHAQFYTPSHSMDHRKRRQWEIQCLPISIEDDVWIGGNVAVCLGVTVGARSVVAAGSVVTKNIEADTMVGGSPAKLIKRLNQIE